MLELSPAYGRDYKSKKDVLIAWNEGKDFVIETFHHPYCGKPCNINDMQGEHIINIRYKASQNVCVIRFKDGKWRVE